jgi:hypothetical protein
MRKLELIREAKLHRLIPGRTKHSRLEASGVARVDDSTAFVVFDNLNQIARIDLSLEVSKRNGLFPAPSLGSGFEDIAVDIKQGRTFCMIESVEDFDGMLRGFVAEYDRDGTFLRCTRLPAQFEKANKGFEGLTHIRHQGREYLYALCEANFKTSRRDGGRIEVFVRVRGGPWQASHRIDLPPEARFKDYSAFAYRHHRIAIASQESARLWVAGVYKKTHALIPGSGIVYRFPGKGYGNIEGIDWLSDDMLVAVSDRKKKDQSDRCGACDQSIHIFRVPGD